MKNILNSLGRKFLMAESTIIIAWVFLWLNKLQGAEFVPIVLGVAGLYFGANVVQGKNKKEVIGGE